MLKRLITGAVLRLWPPFHPFKYRCIQWCYGPQRDYAWDKLG